MLVMLSMLDSSNVYYDNYSGQLKWLLCHMLQKAWQITKMLNIHDILFRLISLMLMLYMVDSSNAMLWQIAYMFIMLSMVGSYNDYNTIYGRQLKCSLCYLWYRQHKCLLYQWQIALYYAICCKQHKRLLCYLWQIAQMLIMLFRLIAQMIITLWYISSNADYDIYSKLIANMFMLSMVDSIKGYYAICCRQRICLLCYKTQLKWLLCYILQIAQMFIMLSMEDG